MRVIFSCRQGECSPILCLAKHPNQQHMIACGNSNGLLFIYDVRSQKKPFIISHTQSEPGILSTNLIDLNILIRLDLYFFSVLEVCFHPFSSDNLISCSYDGSLWYWNASSKGALFVREKLKLID
jgi:nuclear pore complex protein Nup43